MYKKKLETTKIDEMKAEFEKKIYIHIIQKPQCVIDGYWFILQANFNYIAFTWNVTVNAVNKTWP